MQTCPSCHKKVTDLSGTGGGICYGIPVCKDCDSAQSSASFHKLFYLADWDKRVYFFTTDELQRFPGEENYTPVADVATVAEVRAKMAVRGYTEIINPVSEFIPDGVAAYLESGREE